MKKEAILYLKKNTKKIPNTKKPNLGDYRDKFVRWPLHSLQDLDSVIPVTPPSESELIIIMQNEVGVYGFLSLDYGRRK